MDKENQIREYNHALNMIDRKKISINGIKKIDSFDKEEFLIDSVMGYIIIKGNELKLIKLDTKDGILAIKGFINSINYVDENITKKNKENSVISRLFKWF